jgi:hypothetical protein
VSGGPQGHDWDLRGGTLARVDGDLDMLERTSHHGLVSKNPHAVALGRLGGKVGGPARARALSPERRSEIAGRAGRARWNRDRIARVELARQISEEMGADAGIVEHTLRLLEMDPLERLERGLAMSRAASALRRVRP